MTGAASGGIVLARIVAVVAVLADGSFQVGSGYLITGRLVLTAEHCTRDKTNPHTPATDLQVHRADGPRAIGVTVVASSPAHGEESGLDLAVLRLASAPWDEDLPAPVFARVDRSQSGMLKDCQAIGYPFFQYAGSGRRETAELHGTIYQTDLASSGRLMMREPLLPTVTPPPPEGAVTPEGTASSAWGGLSGAVVFHHGRALGVVVEHHPRQGASSVQLAAFDQLLDSAAENNSGSAAVAAALGLSPRVGLALAAAPVAELTEVHQADSRNGELQASQLRRFTAAVLSCPILATEVSRVVLAGVLHAQPDETFADQVKTTLRTGQVSVLLDALVTLANDDEAMRLAALEVRDCWERQLWVAEPSKLIGARVTLQQVRTAFHRAVPPGPRHTVDSLADAVDAAAAFGRRGKPGAPLYRLVAMLEHLTGSRLPDEWFELDDDQLAGLRAGAPRWVEEESTRLVIDLRSGGSPPGVPAWPRSLAGHICRRSSDGAQWTRKDVDCEPNLAGVQRAVRKLVELVFEEGNALFTVGFILPRVLHGSLPEGWLVQPPYADETPLGVEYPVVLHSGERLSRRELHGVWQKRADMVHATLAAELPDITWVEAACRGSSAEIRRVVTHAKTPMIGFGFAPDPTPESLTGDPLLTALVMGVPFMLWVEQEPEDWGVIREHVYQLINGGPFDELDQRLQVERQQHPETLGIGLRLLWDDPDLLPPITKVG